MAALAAQIQNRYTFDPALVAQAVSFPTGTFVSVDDLAMRVNGLGCKVVQTTQIKVDGKEVSVSYVDDDETSYELLRATDHPVELGTYAELKQRHGDLHEQLAQAFGGPGNFTVHEMVTALVRAQEAPEQSADEVAVYARRQVRRTIWVITHRLDAMAMAPVDWDVVEV